MVSQETAVILVVAKTATLVFGGALTYFAYRAYRRTGSPALRTLAVGIGLLVVGTAIGGALHQLAGLGLGVSASVQSVFTAAGITVMTFSLYTDVSTAEDRTRSGPRTGNGPT